MKSKIKVWMVLLVVGLIVLLSGCTSKTELGDCVGIGDDKDPKLVYKLSAGNLFWAILGIELIAPPIIVAVDETFCPVRRRDGQDGQDANESGTAKVPFPGT